MSAIVLTNLGKLEAEKMQGNGPEFAVISLLYEMDGPVDFEEVCDETHMSTEKASMICHGLINKGYVKEA